ncbi:YkgJ family cysteine cluster protein [Candidatus Pacearchaeota archaeon]|nr:YkgJ family cysteine cluster protein [Candidatus Pacearchaeota archaeon]
MNITALTTKEGNSCIFLDSAGKCTVYDDRPFECRIFPFDIQEIDGKFLWVIWTNCPASSKVDCAKMIDYFENTFSKKWPKEYITEYVNYHKLNQPIKYSKNTFKIIREVNWPTD